ncbi:MAG TPA: hypothetical protein VKR54_03690 [Candidatus Babeliales bacterium]|jgi:hypothetical protein|nr:hypothetical protein [Candidatus Babeliales bacterium]
MKISKRVLWFTARLFFFTQPYEKSITDAQDSAQEAQYFAELVGKL